MIMKTTSILALTAVMAMGAGSVSAQQGYGAPGYDAWRAQQDQYQQQQSQYQQQQQAYQDKRDNYDAERADYEARRAKWERDRADYDSRYGSGAYIRRYGEWRYEGYRPVAEGYGPVYEGYRSSPCEQRRSNNSTAGGVIGALAGAALGSNIAARNARTEGAVLGAVVGAGVGASIGRSTAQCDTNGYYYSYNQTYPYNEGQYYRSAYSGEYGYRTYANRRCRLAVAPAYWNGGSDYRYVRVCPDNRGRYRITR